MTAPDARNWCAKHGRFEPSCELDWMRAEFPAHHYCRRKEIAEALLKKIRELQFLGRDKYDPFSDDQLPDVRDGYDRVVLLREQLTRFRDSHALLCAFVAHVLGTDDPTPAHILMHLAKELAPGPAESGEAQP